MLRTILAFFGYVKIPKEAILLSMRMELGYKILYKETPGEQSKILYDSAKAMTGFLRSGRLLSCGEE